MAELTRETRVLRVQCEPIPEMDPASSEWRDWCDGHGMDALNCRSRRAWCGDLSTYLRSSTWVVWHQGSMIALLSDPEFAEETRDADGLFEGKVNATPAPADEG